LVSYGGACGGIGINTCPDDTRKFPRYFSGGIPTRSYVNLNSVLNHKGAAERVLSAVLLLIFFVAIALAIYTAGS
jgi:hypothetical protein